MSQVDTSIYNALLQRPKSVAEYDAEAMQGQQNQLMLQMNRAKIADYQRSQQEENKLADVYRSAVGADGKTDRNALYTGAAAAGLGARLPALQKGYADLDESAAKTAKEQGLAEKAQFEQAREQISFMGQIISAAKDPASYAQGRQLMAARGMDVSQIPEQYDPAYVAQAGQQTMTMAQRIEQEYKAKGFDLDVQKFGETVRNNKEQSAVQVRGQNVSAATAAAGRAQADRHFNATQAREAAVPKGQIVQTEDGPMLVDPRTGTGRVVTGPDGKPLAGIAKPLNDSQSKALLFGTRMQEADKVLADLAKEGTTNSVPGSRAPLIGGAITAMSSQNRQMLDQTKRDFMTATLRRESGAAISSGEYDNADKQYFPQLGDSPGVIAQKARNRALAIQGVLAEVPQKHRASITPPAQAKNNIDALLDKYKD